MAFPVGIDLGTTYSVISYLNESGSVEVIPNNYGNRTTPSIVCYDKEGNPVVGELLPHNSVDVAVQAVKRLMGSNFNYDVCGEKKSPESISSEILKYLKTCAENYLGEEVKDAVITVPAYFNNSQRQATKKAGELAGFNVLRIINEPTAASIAYGIDKKKDATILVYDLGGGTFDVTILKLSDGVDFHVLSTSGNTSLGGIDFDNELYRIIIDKFNDYLKNSVELDKYLELNDYHKDIIYENIEKYKKGLSFSKSIACFIPNFMFVKNKLVDLNISVSRDEFEKAIDKYILQTKDCIEQALSDAELNYQDIDEVVFVGGSTRIPYVYEKVKEWSGKIPNKSINPDEAVSVGAAIQASVLAGQTDKEVYLIDVTPLSLGIETQGGVMSVMIKRNTQVPSEAKEVFTTATDNQTSVDVKVYQGERPQTTNNHYLGEFKLDNIPPMKKGVPKIEVIFDLDANGILTVKAIDTETKIEKSLVLDNSERLENLDINKMLKDAEENKISDEIFIKISNLRELLTNYKIQISELLATKVLNDSEMEDLVDLNLSIDEDINSENIELLNSLVFSAKELVEELSNKVYKEAEKLLR